MLTYFDIEYWVTFVDSNLHFSLNLSQSFCFMHQLHQRVENKMLSEKSDFKTLLFWAVWTAKRKSHLNFDASQLQNDGAYNQFPLKKGEQRVFMCTYNHDSICVFSRMGAAFHAKATNYSQECWDIPSGEQFGISDWKVRCPIFCYRGTRAQGCVTKTSFYREYYNTIVKFKTQSHTFFPLTYTIKSGIFGASGISPAQRNWWSEEWVKCKKIWG